MSVILDALKRSERDKLRHASPQPLIRLYPPVKKSRILIWTVVIASIIGVTSLIFFLYYNELFKVTQTTQQLAQLQSSSIQPKTRLSRKDMPRQSSLPKHTRQEQTSNKSFPTKIKHAPKTKPKPNSSAKTTSIRSEDIDNQHFNTTKDIPVAETSWAESTKSTTEAVTSEDLMLIAALQQALQEVDTSEVIGSDNRDPDVTDINRTIIRRNRQNVVDIREIDASWIDDLPQVDINMHIFSSNPTKRIISVNGQDLHEGDMISPELFIVEIRPEDVIFNFRGNQFKVAATQSW